MQESDNLAPLHELVLQNNIQARPDPIVQEYTKGT